MTVILGGGMAGLSAAYYGLRNPKLGQIVLLEASDRLGGWVKSQVLADGTVFEKGPRLLRVGTASAVNTLNLVDELKLDEKIIPIAASNSKARVKMIYAENKLCPLPTSITDIFKTLPPLKQPLIRLFWNELRSPKVVNKDESIYSFFERRMGKDLADYIISPMICGIFAGDARKLSVKSLFDKEFQAEQKHGSFLKGRLLDIKSKAKKDVKDNTSTEIVSNLAKKAKKEMWLSWCMNEGLEQLPQALAENLRSQGVEIQTKNKCQRLTFKEDHIEVTVNGTVRRTPQVVSSLPARNLAPLVREQHPELAAELDEIPAVTMAVVNLKFPKNSVVLNGLGFLVPPIEKLPILGALIDSNLTNQTSSTVLTVMMGGAWFKEYFGTNPSEEELVNTAVQHMTKILNITKDPTAFSASILKDCIPQYNVGHSERIDRIHNYISSHKMPLALCGASYKGVGINDVILSAKEAVSQIV